MLQRAASPPQRGCPECPETGIHKGDELVCPACGLVLHDSPQVQRRDADSGPPITNQLPEKGLTTSLDWRGHDREATERRQKSHPAGQSLKTWHYRIQRDVPGERNLEIALDELQRLASTLELPESIQRTASKVYRRALANDLIVGWSIEEIATATIYLAARNAEYPRSLAEVETVARCEKRTIGRAYRRLAAELDIDLPPPDPLAFVPRFCSRLSLGIEVERRARDSITRADDTSLAGKHPDGIAAGAVYLGAGETGDHRCLETVAEATHVGINTVSKRARELSPDSG